MTIQQIIKQTEALNQKDFLKYLHKLPEIAKKKYSLNIFLQNFGKQKDNSRTINENYAGSNNKRTWKSKGLINLNGKFNTLNIREDIFNDLMKQYE